VQDCGGGWKFRTVQADVSEPFAACAVRQTDATGWFTLAEMASLRLRPGFRLWVDQHSPHDR
jgi:hypothetical protein